MALHNRVNSNELRQKVKESDIPRTTLSFYRYVKIEDPVAFRPTLYRAFDKLGVFGRIYIAKEGINAQASVPTENLDAFRECLDNINGFENMRLNIAVDDDPTSFFKLGIKVRHKILADGLDDSTFDPSKGGEHLNAVRFNELSQHPEATIIDMRNHYESEIGHFKDSVRPKVDTFRESLPIIKEMLEGKEDKPLLMYCTGGIRCEKASAWFKHQGFKDVYQLDGGIINYAHQVENEQLENRFIGKNFVFDERLGERIDDQIIATCHQCGEPCDTHTNCANDHCHILFIQCKKCAEKYEKCCSHTCSSYASMTKEERREKAKGKLFNGDIFPNGHYRPDMGELPTE